jgi:hypothetical protein
MLASLSRQILSPLMQLDQVSEIQKHHISTGGGTRRVNPPPLLLGSWSLVIDVHNPIPYCCNSKPWCGNECLLVLSFVLHSYYRDDVVYLHV